MTFVPCNHLEWDDSDKRIVCPNPGTHKVAEEWFCSLHYEAAWDAYTDFLSARVD